MTDSIAVKLQDAAERPGPELAPGPRQPIVVRLTAELLEGERK
jgi:hypothetical protein